jgi:hypothetical protein
MLRAERTGGQTSSRSIGGGSTSPARGRSDDDNSISNSNSCEAMAGGMSVHAAYCFDALLQNFDGNVPLILPVANPNEKL